MSNKESSSSSESSEGDKAPDLSALDFGPAWARNDAGAKSKHSSNKSSKSNSKARSPKRKSAPRAGDNKRGHENKRGYEKRGGGHRRDGKSGRHGHGERRPSTPPAEGVSARIMPIEEGMDALAKEISAQGRTHSVFDLAWLVLGGLDRFHVIFESEEQPLYQCKKDHSIWLTKSECLRHFWSSGMVSEYYDEEVTEGEAPTGNFQSVARCGFSGKLIGPPNHHSYQQTLLDLYHERFGNMALERYKSKIVMEHGEEAVEKWIEQVKKKSVWRYKTAVDDRDESAESEVQAKEAEEKDEEDQKDENAAPEDVVADVEPSEPSESSESTESSEPAEAAEPDDPEESVDTAVPGVDEIVPIFKTRREVEQHFLSHGFDEVFKSGKHASVLANVPHKMISPGLMATLRQLVAEEKRYPGKLASFLCRQMSGRHLAVFKWKKRLHCGPARPKHVPDDLVMADRPSKLFHWVLDHPSGSIDKMWKDCLPEGVDDETRHTWYHDLHWLINEGLVLLFSDGTLHAAKEQKPPQQAPKAAEEQPPEKPEQEETPPESSPDAPKTEDP